MVSVYVPASPVGPDLAHDGPLAPVPELADLNHAARFLIDVEPEVWKLRDVRPGLSGIEVPSQAGDGRLIGIFSGLPARLPDRRRSTRAPEPSEATALHGPELWLGLRLEDDVTSEPLIRLPAPRERPRALRGAVGVAARVRRRAGPAQPPRVADPDDPVTGLPSRAEFQVDLSAPSTRPSRRAAADAAHDQPERLQRAQRTR